MWPSIPVAATGESRSGAFRKLVTARGAFILPWRPAAVKHLLAAEALQIMENGKFSALLVVDENKKLVGALNMHDMLRAGVV